MMTVSVKAGQVATSSDPGVELPPGVEQLWDRRQRPARPGLSLDRIVGAAIELADADGLGSLSMARLAERLGSAPMSLYRHVASKDELQRLMVDVAVGEPSPPDGDPEDWRTGLARWAHALLAVYRRHTWIVQIPISGPPLEPGQLSWLERGLSILAPTGLSGDEKLSVMLLMFGCVRYEAQLPAGSVKGMRQYGHILANLLDRQRFPELTELVESGTYNRPADTFTFGLRRVLDGVDALVRRRDSG